MPQLHENARQRIEANLHLLPAHMHGGIKRYFFDGIEPGSFLTAVLSNDLMGALGQADDENINALPAYGRFLHNYAPAGSHGSPARVKAWLEAFADAEVA